jgi:hypothetical protein
LARLGKPSIICQPLASAQTVISSLVMSEFQN